MGWIKTVGERIGKRLADLSTTASQKLEFETKEMLREAIHKDAIKVLKTELERLTQENQELRAAVERLTWENKQAEISISHLEEALHAYHWGEHREPPVSGSGASLFSGERRELDPERCHVYGSNANKRDDSLSCRR